MVEADDDGGQMCSQIFSAAVRRGVYQGTYPLGKSFLYFNPEPSHLLAGGYQRTSSFLEVSALT